MDKQKVSSTQVASQRKLTRFEKWQVVLGVAQTIILMGTLSAAVYIGLQQNRINQQLYDLNFTVSLEITYDNGRLNIVNKGKENVWLWGGTSSIARCHLLRINRA